MTEKARYKHFEFIGPRNQECQMCRRFKKMNFYLKWPHPAIVDLLPESHQGSREICRDCANREAGNKVTNTAQHGRRVTKNKFK